MNKVFYHPETLEIKGFSDGQVSMDFQYVETEEIPLLISNYKIEIVDNVATLKIINESFTEDQWNEVMK